MSDQLKNQPAVCCVIVNWNGWQDTIACLDVLKKCDYPALTPVVVDNGSTNGSEEKIRAAHPDVTVLQSGANLGFAGGNNVGFRWALKQDTDFRWFWMLNNDTEAAPDALSELIAKGGADPKTGAVSSVCYYHSDPERVQAWGGAQINLWTCYARNTLTPEPDAWFDCLYGASMMVRREVLDEVGLMDEGFFLYLEETEFCLRIKKAGWKMVVAADSKILHKVNASSGGNAIKLDRYFTTSGLRILKLHSPAPWIAMPLFFGIRLIRRLLRGEFSRIRSVFSGLRDYTQMCPVRQKIR